MSRLRVSILALALILAASVPAMAQQTNEPKRAKQPLTDEQRAELEQRLDEQWSKMSVREKSHALSLHRALRNLPPEERKFVNDRIGRFLDMPPEEKQKLKENAERWKTMTPEQREQARQEFRQRRQAFEEKWKQEHPGEDPPPFPYRGEPKSAPPPAVQP